MYAGSAERKTTTRNTSASSAVAALEEDSPAEPPPGDEVPAAQPGNAPERRGFSDHSSYPDEILTNLFPAILVIIFCCMPFGVVAIAFAAIASNHLASFNREAAIKASEIRQDMVLAGLVLRIHHHHCPAHLLVAGGASLLRSPPDCGGRDRIAPKPSLKEKFKMQCGKCGAENDDGHICTSAARALRRGGVGTSCLPGEHSDLPRPGHPGDYLLLPALWDRLHRLCRDGHQPSPVPAIERRPSRRRTTRRPGVGSPSGAAWPCRSSCSFSSSPVRRSGFADP